MQIAGLQPTEGAYDYSACRDAYPWWPENWHHGSM